MEKKLTAEVQQDFEKDIAGLKDGGDNIGKCRSCDKSLFKVVKVKDENPVIRWGVHTIEITEQRFKSNCPYCKSQSWVVKQNGTLIYAAIDSETRIDDVDMGEPENGIITNVLEVSKL